MVAASRGHRVTLFEKDHQLGGNLLAAAGPEFKGDWKRFVDYMLRQMEASSVEVRLGVEATPERVKAETPDEVVVAVGGEAVLPDLPGIDSPAVVFAADVMKGANVPGHTAGRRG